MDIRTHESLKQHTTLQVGGTAEQYVKIDTEEDLQEVILYAQNQKIDLVILGGGSNVLISDEIIDGLVIHMAIKGIAVLQTASQVNLTVGAGESLDAVVQYAIEKGYWGIENLSHIPGTVGAAPVQNVGAYGVEVKDVIGTVRVYNMESNTFESLSAEECQFGYRDSLFKTPEGRKYIVVSVTLNLSTTAAPILSYRDLQNRFVDTQPGLNDIRQAVIEIRAAKFPDWKVVGTAGSFFKNPVIPHAQYDALLKLHPELPGFSNNDGSVKIPLGWILDKVLNIKGDGNEKVGTYQGQALVLVNKGEATATDFIAFANEISKKVLDAVGIEIQWEVTQVGI